MISGRLFNNIGIEALSIAFVLNHEPTLSVSKAVLVSPIVAHNALLTHLARKTTKILSFEKYLIEHISNFSNFNRRYYDGLVNSMNSVQLLSELDVIEFIDGHLKLKHPIEYKNTMGKRAEKVSKAASNIAALLSESSEKLYLNLRIEL
ncbi:MAG: hypothetical protein WA790_14705 [Sulfitobacter sp.]